MIPPAEVFAPQQVTIPQNSITIFLAGTIDMGSSEDWQKEIQAKFAENQKIFCFFNPRRTDWDSSWKQVIQDPRFNEQVTWELDRIFDCSIVYMHFEETSKSPISLLELGLIAGSEKLVIVYCPDGFYRKGNVDITCERFGVPVYNTKEAAFEALNKLIDSKYEYFQQIVSGV